MDKWKEPPTETGEQSVTPQEGVVLLAQCLTARNLRRWEFHDGGHFPLTEGGARDACLFGDATGKRPIVLAIHMPRRHLSAVRQSKNIIAIPCAEIDDRRLYEPVFQTQLGDAVRPEIPAREMGA